MPVGSLAKAGDLARVFEEHAHYEEDFVDVKGQDYAKRALVIAAAGAHNVLTSWPVMPNIFIRGETARV